MDVRAKQRLCYRVTCETLACVYPVSPHVISSVVPLLVMNVVSEIETMWNEWKAIPFPSYYAGEEVESICLVSLDTYTAGCVETFVSRKGSLDAERISILKKCEKDLETITDKLEGDAKFYFERLLQMTQKILKTVKAK